MVARSVEASSCFEMAEMATPEVVITPVMFCDYLERLKTSAFSIPSDRNTIATRLVNEIQALAKTEHGEAVSNFCTELNSALVQIAENKASCSKISTRKQRIWREFHKAR